MTPTHKLSKTWGRMIWSHGSVLALTNHTLPRIKRTDPISLNYLPKPLQLAVSYHVVCRYFVHHSGNCTSVYQWFVVYCARALLHSESEVVLANWQTRESFDLSFDGVGYVTQVRVWGVWRCFQPKHFDPWVEIQRRTTCWSNASSGNGHRKKKTKKLEHQLRATK